VTMTPISTQILDHVIAQVAAATGLSTVQVHAPSVTQTDAGSIPDILVFSVIDQPHGDPETDSSGGQTRALTFAVDITITGTNAKDTDPLAILCRKAVLSDATLGCLALDTAWAGQEWGEGGSATPLVFTKIIFTSRYNWSPEW